MNRVAYERLVVAFLVLEVVQNARLDRSVRVVDRRVDYYYTRPYGPCGMEHFWDGFHPCY